MSMIHFVGGEKGGVGKSVMARVLSQYFLDSGRDYIGLDADQSHPTLTRYYSDYTRAVVLDRFESIDQIVELAVETDRLVLVDLPAQSQRFLDRWIEDNAVLELTEEAGIPVTFWYVVDDGRDSARLFADFRTRYGQALNCVLVMNQGCGSDFSEVQQVLDTQPETAAAWRTDRMQLPSLHAGTMRKIDKLNFSFWAAVNVKESTGSSSCLSLMERQRAKVWQRKAYAAIERVFLEP
jgi:hypothetical protein